MVFHKGGVLLDHKQQHQLCYLAFLLSPDIDPYIRNFVSELVNVHILTIDIL